MTQSSLYIAINIGSVNHTMSRNIFYHIIKMCVEYTDSHYQFVNFEYNSSKFYEFTIKVFSCINDRMNKS